MNYICSYENDIINCNSTNFPVGTRIIAQCGVNFYPDNIEKKVIECTEDGEWKNFFKCIPNITSEATPPSVILNDKGTIIYWNKFWIGIIVGIIIVLVILLIPVVLKRLFRQSPIFESSSSELNNLS